MNPKISLIIATKNASKTIGSCVDSIVSQSYPTYEIVVQDAVSIDGIEKILGSYDREKVRVFVEDDTGIYDAWNRALRRTTGDWVMFLGADDRLAHERVLENRVDLLRRTTGPVELVSGRIAFVDKAATISRVIGAAWDWPAMLKYQSVVHIGLMHHRSLFDRFGLFDSRYRIAGDYDFLLRFGRETRALFINEIEILAGGSGISQTEVSRALWETYQIQAQHKEIGPLRGALNFTLAWMKYGYRWLRK